MLNPLDLANVDINITSIPIAHFIHSKKKNYYIEKRPYYCFIFVLHGSLTFISKNEEATANAGEILVINKGEDYNVIYNRDQSSGEVYFFIVEFDLLDKDLSFLKRVNKVKYPDFYLDICKELESNSSFFHITQGGHLIKSKALLYEMIYNLFKENYKQRFSASEENLEKAKNYIDANLKEKLTLEKLASIAGYSVPYFKRAFKKFYKIPPGEYINELRINKAKVMLASKTYTITEIANECGFSSESYFSHAFKNAVGVSPKQY